MNLDGNFPTYERQKEILDKTTDIKSALESGAMGKTPRRKVFTTNGTWTAPIGVTKVFITGGGGGGGGAYNVAPLPLLNGTAGGATSFGSLLTLTGGGGGIGGALNVAVGGAAGGNGGESGMVVSNASASIYLTGKGGAAGPYKGGNAFFANETNPVRNGGYCSGGAGLSTGASVAAGSGGSGDFVHGLEVGVTPGQIYNVTIGVGGSGGYNGANRAGQGGQGILTIEWWE